MTDLQRPPASASFSSRTNESQPARKSAAATARPEGPAPRMQKRTALTVFPQTTSSIFARVLISVHEKRTRPDW